MNDCCCSFQSATGLSSETTNVDLTAVYNAIDISSNNNYDFTFNVNSYYSNNSNIVNSNISNIYYILSNNSNLTGSNVSNIYYNYGIIDSNLGFYQLELFKTQLDVIAQKGQIVGLQTSDTIQSGSITTMSVTQIDHGTRISSLENNTYNKSTTDTLISNSSNSSYSNASNLSLSFSNNINTNLNNNLFTRNQLSNIFITSNVLSNTSNTLADYNNLYNKPSIYTRSELSNIFITSNVLSNTSNFLINYNNLINLPSIYTRNELSNIFITSNVLSNTSNFLINYNNLINLPSIYTRNELSNIFVTSNLFNNYNKWISSGSNLYNLDCNIGIGTTNPNYKLDIIGSISSLDYNYSNVSLFKYEPEINPIFTNATKTIINSTNYYFTCTQSGTLTIPYPITCDILIVGAGGRGGTSAYGGGGGAGEVIYNQSLQLQKGIYNITVGIDSATTTSRISKFSFNTTDLFICNGGGNGGGWDANTTAERRYPSKLYNSITNAITSTINSQACVTRDFTLDTTGITYGNGTYSCYYSSRGGSGFEGNLVFDYVETGYSTAWKSVSYYATYSPYDYYGTSYLVESTYKGEFMVLKLPYPVMFTSHTIKGNPNFGINYVPNNFKIYASRDGTNWVILDTVVNASYTSLTYTSSTFTNTNVYLYFGMVVNKVKNGDLVNINEWIINGKEYILTPPSSGGSGGGGYGNISPYIQSGASAGTPFNISSKLQAGNNGIANQGGDGGSALITGGYTDVISGLTVGIGGNGATSSSTPVIKTNYGSGGDGNGGLASQGVVIMKFSNSNVTKFLEWTNWEKIYYKPNLFTQQETSNIFVTSNVLSNTSNFLIDYNNLINLPSIYTRSELSNIFVTSNVLSNTSNFLINYSNLINLPSIYTRSELSNIFVTSNVLNNTSNNCIDFSKVLSNNCIDFSKVLSNNCIDFSKVLSNNCIDFSKVLSNNSIDFSKVLSNNIKTDINTSITTLNLDVNKSYDFTFSDSILHVGNNLCIRNINPAYGTFFNEMSLCLGIGNASLINLIPFFNNIVVSSSPEFSGLKIHRNGIVLLNSSNNLIINTLDDVQINGANILFSGKLNFGGTVGTKAPRFFTTNRTASFGGVNCLAYDIDLDLYTRKETIGFYEQRHFKIKFIFGNGRIDYQWAPKEIEVGLSTYNGLSAFAYDVQGTNSLDEAIDYNYFLYKQSIDRITVCFPTYMYGTNHLTIYFIIQDYLAL